MANPNFHHPILKRLAQQIPSDHTPDTPAEREAFLRVLAIELNRHGSDFRLDPRSFTVHRADGRLDWLQHRWDTFRTTPRTERPALLQRLGMELSCTPTALGPPLGRADLLPRIRHRYHHHAVFLFEEYTARWSPSPTIHPLGEHLTIELVFDRGSAFIPASQQAIAALGLDPQSALAQARQNLLDRCQTPFTSEVDGFFQARVGDCLDSARLVLVDQIDSLGLRGAPVALPANRHTLCITGEADLSGLEKLLEMTVASLHRPRLDTVRPVVLSGGRWTSWEPEATHVLAAPFQELWQRARAGQHAHQRKQLQNLHQQRGVRMSVSPLEITRQPGVPIRTNTRWPAGPVLLPHADDMTIEFEAGTELCVPWWAVEATCAELLEPAADLWPPLFYASAQPDLVQRLLLTSIASRSQDGAS